MYSSSKHNQKLPYEKDATVNEQWEEIEYKIESKTNRLKSFQKHFIYIKSKWNQCELLYI